MQAEQKGRDRLISDLFEINFIISTTFARYNEEPRDYGENDVLYMREAHLICFAAQYPESTMSDLARMLHVTQGAVSQTAARLESKGYIERYKKPENKRLVYVRTTEKGEAFFRRHLIFDAEQHKTGDEKFFADFTDEQIETVVRLQYRFYEMLRSDNRSAEKI